MTQHYWGDDWFESYGHDLYDAMKFIREECYKRARMRVHMKEKYGTLRWEATFTLILHWGGWGPLHNYFYPGYVFNQFANKRFIGSFLCWLDKMALSLYIWMGWDKSYNEHRMNTLFDVVEEACVMWPTVATEIVDDLNWEFECPRAQALHDKYYKPNAPYDEP